MARKVDQHHDIFIVIIISYINFFYRPFFFCFQRASKRSNVNRATKQNIYYSFHVPVSPRSNISFTGILPDQAKGKKKKEKKGKIKSILLKVKSN